MTDQELTYWLGLKLVPGLGNVGFISLLETFPTPQDVFQASVDELLTINGIGPKIATAIRKFDSWSEAERELQLANKLGISLVTCRDALYPANLLNIYDYPPILYVKGTFRTDETCIALVGSRMASTYGRFSTDRLARQLAMQGITVVSGLARGIDTAAHLGSLAAKGRTIAVLGCGLDIIYPPENKDLFNKIAAQGAVITEFPLGTPPQGTNFPARNRIISGISLGVVVVEASYRSGSLITARVALEQGREVFAVPGSVDAEGSKGTNKLIKEGAKLVENADDILDEILPQIRHKLPLTASSKTAEPAGIAHASPEKALPADTVATICEEEEVLRQLSTTPVHVDQLASITGKNVAEILNILLLLELKGLIHQLPGKQFVRKE